MIRSVIESRIDFALMLGMHSLYTLNHPFGRGIPLDPSEDADEALNPHVWK